MPNKAFELHLDAMRPKQYKMCEWLREWVSELNSVPYKFTLSLSLVVKQNVELSKEI